MIISREIISRNKYQMKNERLNFVYSPSPNFDERTRPIRFVILHYTGMKTEEKALQLLTDGAPTSDKYSDDIVQMPPNAPPPDESGVRKLNRVSSHYVVFTDGTIHCLVDEKKRAWHAGAGNYDIETDMNSASIGIEIHNGGHDFGLPPYPKKQIDAVMQLVREIKIRNGLDKHAIIGHSDWAPNRKIDPGEHFPWERFANAGISLKIPKSKNDANKTILASLENEENEYVLRAKQGLKKIGYGVSDNAIFDNQAKLALIAFQRRFRQTDVKGNLDVDCLSKIERLAKSL